MIPRISQSLQIFLFFLVNACVFTIAGCMHNSQDNSSVNNISNVYNLIKSDYVRPITDQTLTQNAVRGMLEGLDSNSTYLDEKNYEFLKQLSDGKYAGIGIEVMPVEIGLKIITLQKNSPALSAGLMLNDIIISANHQNFKNTPPAERVQLLRGPANTTVEIQLLRNNTEHPLTIMVQRKIIPTDSVKYKLYPDNIGYIKITFFEKNTAELVKHAVDSLQQNEKLSGLILDLRNNPGGLLESAADVSDLFLDYKNMLNNHLIVSNINRQGKVMYYARKDDQDIIHQLPMIVLINHNSASSAEIVAAALHDHHRALLLGTKSFGKGSVQKLIPLGNNNGAVKITTGYYYTPSGKLIDKIGIYPDITIINPNAQLSTAQKWIREKKHENFTH